jgi:catechol 2,3-dioxygenase-like lactoylglutathione lyase family enzyme
MPLRVTHIDHVTVLVTDLAGARAFYSGVLGLTEIPPPKEFDFVAVWYDLGGQYLHLLQKPHPDAPSPRHFCLHVEDIGTAREHMRTLGVPTDETVKIAAADRFFVRDPDGNRIELLQWQRPYRPDADGRASV